MLHPSHKLQYFKNHEWEEGWIDEAARITKRAFLDNYATVATATAGAVAASATMHTAASTPSTVRNLPLFHIVTLTLLIQNIFDQRLTFSVPKAQSPENELTSYLNAIPEPVTNALKWWHERRTIYPCLSRMALDYLSMPGKLLSFTGSALEADTQCQLLL